MNDETTDDPSLGSPGELADESIGEFAGEFNANFSGEFASDAGPSEDDDFAPETNADEPPKARHVIWAPRTRIAVVSLALVAMMFVFVFPTRSYLAQKRQVGQAADAVAVLKAQNQVLEQQASRLKTRAEIERLAREQFNMVLPGEQAYNVVETPTGPTTTTVP